MHPAIAECVTKIPCSHASRQPTILVNPRPLEARVMSVGPRTAGRQINFLLLLRGRPTGPSVLERFSRPDVLRVAAAVNANGACRVRCQSENRPNLRNDVRYGRRKHHAPMPPTDGVEIAGRIDGHLASMALGTPRERFDINLLPKTPARASKASLPTPSNVTMLCGSWQGHPVQPSNS